MNNKNNPIERFIHELRRRRVFKTAALYIVSAWLIMQVADVVFPALEIPETAIRYILYAVVLGFPAALVFGWYFDVGTSGIRRTPPADAEEQDLPLKRSDYVVLAALAVVVGAILYSTVNSVVETPTQPRIVRNDGPPVVAVLPFSASSLEGESDFFATGVHDDLLTQLSKLESIRVISRTSVLEYKDTTKNMREIGLELGANMILEGGVQVAGEQIRINAQLIESATDEHLWAETYDRSLSAANIFDVQQDIARAITAAMNTTLTEQDNKQLSSIPTENMAAYRAYHRAMEGRAGHSMTQEERVEALKEAVSLDPGFTRAWAELAGVYALISFGNQNQETIQKAEHALETVAEIAPDSADYYVAQAYYFYYVLKDYDQAHEILGRAISTNPSDISLLELRSWIERRQGDFTAREATIRTMIQLDPRNPSYRNTLLVNFLSTHQYDKALEATWLLGPDDINLAAYREFIKVRDHGDFKQLLENMKKLEGRMRGWDKGHLWFAYIANRDYENAAKILESIEDPAKKRPGNLSGWEETAIVTYLLMGNQGRLDELLPPVRARLEAARKEDGTFENSFSYRYLSLVLIGEGDFEGSLKMLRKFVELDSGDIAGKIFNTDRNCAMFGMNGAAPEAVGCLREGLSGPSMVMPFIDPYLPFYDPVRDSPEFIELITELESQ